MQGDISMTFTLPIESTVQYVTIGKQGTGQTTTDKPGGVASSQDGRVA